MVARQRIIFAILACIFVLLAARQHWFVNHYSVNVLYWDGWELHRSLFSSGSWWSCFDLQHGPHRQGVGGLLTRILASHSRWNSRWEAFAVSFALMAAALLGIWLAFRCGVRGWALLIVPPIYLNIRQCQMFIANPNPSHGALPIFMFTAYCLAFFTQKHRQRLAIQSLLIFLLIFTGFGLFAGVIAPVVLLVELIHTIRADESLRRGRFTSIVAALVTIAASWWLFSWKYRFDPAVPGFRFPYERPIEYLYFIGAMIGNFFGLTGASPIAVGVGLFIFALMILICGVHLLHLFKSDDVLNPREATLFSLSAFTVMFAIQAAVGRTFLGWQTGTASRYVTLMIPMALTLLIQLDTPTLGRRGLALIYGCLLVMGTLNLRDLEINGAGSLHNACLNWRAAYLQTHDQNAADRIANFSIHPGDLTNQLRYLQDRKLNLFDDDSFKPQININEP